MATRIPNEKIRLLCPEGHVMFPEGINRRTLFKTYAVRLQAAQLFSDGYDWSRAEAFYRKHGCSEQQFKAMIRKQQKLPMCPAYCLSTQQYDQMKAKRWCSECKEAEK